MNRADTVPEADKVSIGVPTLGGFIWLVRASDPFTDDSGNTARSLSMSNNGGDAGYWPRDEALVLLEEVRRHWPSAVLVPL